VTGRTDRRLNPDELLRRVQAEERRERRGRLKIFLGYAPRVGKSLRMFGEGRRRKERGEDVVIAAAQTEIAVSVREIVSRLEIVPERYVACLAAMKPQTLMAANDFERAQVKVAIQDTSSSSSSGSTESKVDSSGPAAPRRLPG